MTILPGEIIHRNEIRIVKVLGNFPTEWAIERRKTRWLRPDVWVIAKTSYNQSGAYCGDPWELRYKSHSEAIQAMARILSPYYQSIATKEVL